MTRYESRAKAVRRARSPTGPEQWRARGEGRTIMHMDFDDDDISEDIRRWNQQCLIWEAVALAVISVAMGACTAVAVWLW